MAEMIHGEVPSGLPGVTPQRGLWWGSLFAGMLAALSIFALLSVLGMAVGFSASGTAVGTGFTVGFAIWLVILSIICFCIGGFIAVRAAGTRGDGSGLMHGAMVWALAVPILTLALIFASISTSSANNSGVNPAQLVVLPQNAANPPVTHGENATAPQQVYGYAPAQQSTANQGTNSTVLVQGLSWSLFFSLLLGLCAACLGGFLAARGREHETGGPNRVEPAGPVM